MASSLSVIVGRKVLGTTPGAMVRAAVDRVGGFAMLSMQGHILYVCKTVAIDCSVAVHLLTYQTAMSVSLTNVLNIFLEVLGNPQNP